MTPKISVIMPVYNCAEYLEEAIQSMLEQTFDDIEIICVEDGSPDNSKEVLQRVAKKHKKVKAFYFKKNKGISAALNKAIAEAKAPLVARMDGDDICDPKRLQDQYDYLQQNPEVDLVGTDLYYMSAEGKKLGVRRLAVESFEETLKVRSPIAHATILARKKEVEKAGCYDSAYDYGEDYPLWIRMYLQGNTFGHIPKAYYGYRLQPNATKFSRTKKQLRSTIRAKADAKKKYGFRLGITGEIRLLLERMLLLLPSSMIVWLFQKVELR